jgi:hypothetical protein
MRRMDEGRKRPLAIFALGGSIVLVNGPGAELTRSLPPRLAKAIEEGELDLATARLGALRTLAAELDNAPPPDARACVKFVNMPLRFPAGSPTGARRDRSPGRPVITDSFASKLARKPATLFHPSA